MALINCPECGQQISDMAQICPSCGVEIAGNVSQCKHCGKLYLTKTNVCKACGKSQNNETGHTQKQEQPKKTNKKRTIYIVLAVAALLIISLTTYVVKDFKGGKEEEAYELAMKSNDENLLKNFLLNYADAPQEHIDSINAKLDQLRKLDLEWKNVLAANSVSTFKEYILKYPNTPYKGEIEDSIDHLEFLQAVDANSIDMFDQYINAHPYGKYVDEAQSNIKKIKANTVQSEEKIMIKKLIQSFFVSVNANNENGLSETLGDNITSFLGKVSPSYIDIVKWMNNMHKENVIELLWKVNGSYNISKRDVGDEMYEYNVSFNANKNAKYTDGTSSNDNYKVKVTISPDERISSMMMNKIVISDSGE